MAYISVAVEVDPAAITQEKIDFLQDRIPGLELREGHVLYHLIEATSERDAANAELLTEVTDLIWDTFGEKILRVARNTATQATGASTWTRVDTPDFPLSAPLTVPAGTGLTLLASDGSRVAFTTVNTVMFTAAAAATAAGEVQIVAVEAGAAGTGLQGGPQPDETFPWLASIVVTAPTIGGAEEETVEDYRVRLGDEASLMARTLVLAADYEARARTLNPGGRALGIDNYLPGTGSGQAGHMTVAVVNSAGQDPGSTKRAADQADMQTDSVAGLAVHVIGPTFTTITVVFAAKSYAGFDPAAVEAAGEQAVLDFLSGARWGLPPFGDQRLWLDKPVVRWRDVVAVIEGVEGLDYTLAPTGTATTTSGSPNLTLVTPTTGWVNGMAVTGAGIPAGTTILSGAGTATMVMSANASASAAGVAVTGAAVTVNGGTVDVTLTGPAAMPGPSSTANGTVTA